MDVVELMSDTATNAQLARGFFPATSFGTNALFSGLRGTATEDSTATKNLAVTAQWSSAVGVNQQIVMEHATLETVK
jgi:hypothetical protein